jgi:DNA-binding MarR family transcriptional regulator
LTGLLDGLEQRGWVRRVDVDGDRRGVRLEVTVAGMAALRAAELAASERMSTILEAVPDEERRAVLTGLAALSNAFADQRAAKA